MTTKPPPEGLHRPAIVAALSFVWPGLGHYYAGRGRAATLFAVPTLIIALAVLSQLIGGLESAAVTLLNPTFALTLLILVILVGAWRILAIADSFVRSGDAGTRRSRQARGAIAASILGVLLMHSVAGYYAWAFYDAGSRIFDTGPGTAVESPGLGGTGLPNESDFLASPAATPESDSARVNILLTGIDSGNNRNHALTDTLLVISIDPVTGQVAMLSIPRDVARFPLYQGGIYNNKINSLMTAARLHPTTYPDGPINTLANEVGFLIGVPIHYTAAINLAGFERMINLVGGVDIVVERRIADSSYDWFDGTYGFYLSAGTHHLDGRTALAFVRSRNGAGDNDFTRANRQQQLIVALRATLNDPKILARLPQILDAAASTITTNFPADRVKEFLAIAKATPDDAIQRFVLGPPYAIHPPTNTTGGIYILELKFDKIAALSVRLFGADSRYYGASPSPSAAP